MSCFLRILTRPNLGHSRGDLGCTSALLEDLGLLANLKTSTVEFAAAMFNEFDVNDDGVLSFEEFKGVYNAAKDDAAGKPRAPPKPKAVEQRTADGGVRHPPAARLQPVIYITSH